MRSVDLSGAEAQRANQPYACPNCKGNRVNFTLVFSVEHPVTIDARTGEITGELDPPSIEADGGQPEIDVQCRSCGFTGPEAMFISMAKRQPPW